MGLAHGPLAQVKHDFPLHLVNVLLEVLVVLGILRLAPAVVAPPGEDDGGREGDRDGKVDPELRRDVRGGAWEVARPSVRLVFLDKVRGGGRGAIPA